MTKYKLDKNLIIISFLFMIISITSIYSTNLFYSSYGNYQKQLIWYIISFIIMYLITKINLKSLYKIVPFIYISNLILLLLVLFIGQEINGSRCWIKLPGLGSFQPSEFMKITLIIMLSKELGKLERKRKEVSLKEEIILLLKIFLIIIIPTILTFLEPDTGAILMYLVITLIMLLTSKIHKKWFIILGSLLFIIIILFIILYITNEAIILKIFGTNIYYRINRLIDWKNQSGMQLENALTVIASSNILGHGYNNIPLYYPEASTDFIFASIASNFGFLGVSILLLLLLVFDLYLINISLKLKNSNYKLLLIGIISLLIYQQIQNIGMNIGILPITGITLPFISYGGSSLLSYMIMLGLILNITKKKKKVI